LGVTALEPKQKGMCIATRCTSVDQFVQMFHRFVDEDSFFVSTVNTRPPGLETSFSVQLADGTPVLRGLCTVLQAWTTATSPFKTPGVRLGIKRLTANSMPVFERLLVTRSVTPPPAPTAALAEGTSVPRPAAQATAVIEAPKFSDTVPTKIASRAPLPGVAPMSGPKPVAKRADDDGPEIVIEQRTPGSDLILPANPLQHLTDASLEGYVDCTLYEESANFFAVDDGSEVDELVPPPAPAAPPPTFAPRPVAVATPVEIVAEPAFLEEPTSEPTVESTREPPRRPAPTPPPIPVVRADAAPIPTLAVRPDATPIPTPPIAARADATPPPQIRELPPTRESTPSGEILTAIPAPQARRRRGLLVAAGGVAIAASLGAWILLRSGNDDAAPSPAPTTPPKTAAPPEAIVPTLPEPKTPDVEPAPARATTEVDGEEQEATAPGTEGMAPTAGEGPCKLSVTSTPAGSTVILDGKAIAPSPIIIATTCDRHKIDFKHPRYQLGSKFVALKEGTDGSVDITLQRPTHAVKVTSQPSGATIFINGNRAGTTPTVLNVMGFSNLKLEVKKTGYAPLSQKLYSKVPQDTVAVKLTKW